MTTVDVVTVTYRATDLALECVRSVGRVREQCPELVVRMFVLDNNSGDDTIERVSSSAPWISAVSRTSNDGFAVATNQGIRMGSGEFVLVLNPDTEVTAPMLRHLVQRMKSDPTIGVVGPRLVDALGRFDHAAKRNSPGPAAAFRHLAGKILNRDLGSDYLAPQVGETESGDVDAVNGAFMLMRRSDLARVGLLDESYWMYGEDLEWCRRFKACGLRVVYDGSVTAIHHKGGSSGAVRSPRTNWHFHASMWRYYNTESQAEPTLRRVLVASGIGAHWVLTSIKWLLHRLRGTA
ncbi:glycosyltransferase family 2 protein [Nocardioides sp. zg-1228]|uniref:glycosyltransferase family 2 protein n=1 Tax=Nocardioides sp. zg-1228 TaxID=2763008 RepID=UPI001643274C|nr:glycosyltransferase family 2 protein [Nocardioides sp. zg-1228]MBC2931653.1 glycosyltransferase family 2 protein [Nocardioides sp. zg-1228]QSF57244.1 glycosyltransferase family 2 protein [Nocardioides sp. zg-1228]